VLAHEGRRRTSPHQRWRRSRTPTFITCRSARRTQRQTVVGLPVPRSWILAEMRSCAGGAV